MLHGSSADVLLIRDRGLPERVEKIAVALSTDRSEFTLACAIDLASGFGAFLRIVSISPAEEEKEKMAVWFERARSRMKELGVMGDAEIIRSDQPIEAMVEAADAADLFVMGASRDWVERKHLLGAIPDRVANRSRTTVAVAKKEEARILSHLRRMNAWVKAMVLDRVRHSDKGIL